jgi:hypothetical protein
MTDYLDTSSESSEESYKNVTFEKEYDSIFHEMKDMFEEYKILEKSKKKNSEFNFKELIEYKNTEKEETNYTIPFSNNLLEIETLNIDNIELHETYIIPYFICNDAILPFLIFFFQKNISQELNFFNYLHTSSSIEQNIETLLKTFFKKKNMKISGYHYQDNKYYFYVEIKNYQSLLLTNYSTFVPILLDELINTTYYLNTPIPFYLTNYFCDNINMFILNVNDCNIEVPTVVYTSNPIKKCEFYSVFGIPSNNLIVDNQYTFFSLEEILTKTIKENDGINRSIIFCGKQHYIKIEDFTEDDLLNNDSLFIYNHLLYKYIWLIKEYQQQYSISYHYVKDLLT